MHQCSTTLNQQLYPYLPTQNTQIFIQRHKFISQTQYIRTLIEAICILAKHSKLPTRLAEKFINYIYTHNIMLHNDEIFKYIYTHNAID